LNATVAQQSCIASPTSVDIAPLLCRNAVT
jgi:hypothetical protein